ncbi:AAA family ATPase [bacterium]|jgi:guanylate kinase|nr:AAA family ATPase [bacterium]
MKNHKRIILVGPAAAGKTYIRDAFIKKSYEIDISYTSRKPRYNEIDGIDYHFIDINSFHEMIKNNKFYEYVKFGENYYGTSEFSWENSDVFIMETSGISKIRPEDRKNCLIIYVNTPYKIRLQRMQERNWNNEKIQDRIKQDIENFNDFKDYDIEISSEIYNNI